MYHFIIVIIQTEFLIPSMFSFFCSFFYPKMVMKNLHFSGLYFCLLFIHSILLPNLSEIRNCFLLEVDTIKKR